MKRLLLISTCLLAATAAVAQSSDMQSPAYRECTTLATSNPAQALTKAEAWLKIDTGIAAQHCRAMALYGLRRFVEAGEALTGVREMISPENISLRSYVTRQASRAFVGANSADRSLGILGAQIADISSHRGNNAVAAKLTSELLLDRARIHVSFGKLDDAAKDLDHAVSLTPINEDVLMERAGVFEKLGDMALARSDVEVITKINPTNAQARNMLERLNGTPRPMTDVAIPSVVEQPVVSADAKTAAEMAPAAAAPKRKSYKSRAKKPATNAQ
jgi:hypothetical protein